MHFSVAWWSTLHQPNKVDAPLVYLVPLLVLTLAYAAAFGALWLVRIRAEVWRRRANVLALKAAG